MDDIDSRYEIPRTAEFLRGRAYTRVALQFPDEMLKDAVAVARALRRELGGGGVKVFVMADTAYNSCCVDEVGASHIDAQCVVHYGHACMSPTSNLPALFVFWKAPLNVNACGRSLLECSKESNKRILVLCGLEYAHALDDLKGAIMELCKSHSCSPEVQYADVLCSVMSPSSSPTAERPQSNGSTHNDDLSIHSDGVATSVNNCCNVEGSTRKYSLGGLTWGISIDEKMEDYLLCWIGQDNSAFANIVLTFNKCDIVRYDTIANQLSRDVSHLMKILRRRYYLVEKAKDANIIGILVGTLGVDEAHSLQQNASADCRLLRRRRGRTAEWRPAAIEWIGWRRQRRPGGGDDDDRSALDGARSDLAAARAEVARAAAAAARPEVARVAAETAWAAAAARAETARAAATRAAAAWATSEQRKNRWPMGNSANLALNPHTLKL